MRPQRRQVQPTPPGLVEAYRSGLSIRATEHPLVGRGVNKAYLVGMTGFEPATLRSQSGCATKLRHIP